MIFSSLDTLGFTLNLTYSFSVLLGTNILLLIFLLVAAFSWLTEDLGLLSRSILVWLNIGPISVLIPVILVLWFSMTLSGFTTSF
jgi:hypothetical protein